MRPERGFAFIPLLLVILIGVAVGIFVASEKYQIFQSLSIDSGEDESGESPVNEGSDRPSAYESLKLRKILDATYSARTSPAPTLSKYKKPLTPSPTASVSAQRDLKPTSTTFTPTPTKKVTLTPSPTLTSFVTVSLSGQIYSDKNCNNIKESSETGIAGVSVDIQSPAGILYQTVVSDNTGRYSFSQKINTDQTLTLRLTPKGSNIVYQIPFISLDQGNRSQTMNISNCQ